MTAATDIDTCTQTLGSNERVTRIEAKQAVTSVADRHCLEVGKGNQSRVK